MKFIGKTVRKTVRKYNDVMSTQEKFNKFADKWLAPLLLILAMLFVMLMLGLFEVSPELL
jgi:hypothetical protein